MFNFIISCFKNKIKRNCYKCKYLQVYKTIYKYDEPCSYGIFYRMCGITRLIHFYRCEKNHIRGYIIPAICDNHYTVCSDFEKKNRKEKNDE